MHIVTTPEPETIQLEDLDLCFAGQAVYPITIKPADGDTIEETPDAFVITYAKHPEVITIPKVHVLWWSRKTRTVKVIPPQPATDTHPLASK